MTYDDDHIRTLLTQAVPVLRPPQDRLDLVEHRLRRRRRWIAAGGALAVLLAAGLAVGGIEAAG
ncbi:hypothetical protein ABT008_27750 [Micromonospora sp. NPDC002389]|uniref:hypothetical protein n=1 Tax=Micromonospora sp. NPDC002389 TaxID=3154272 RepID=UPI0033204E73